MSNSILVINPVRSSKTRLFAHLEHVEVSCPQFSKHCFGFILKNAINLVSIKVQSSPESDEKQRQLKIISVRCFMYPS